MGSRSLGSEGRFAASYFALFSVFGVITPYFQKLLDIQGFSKQDIGFIFAAFETVGILAPPLWGWLSDHSRGRLHEPSSSNRSVRFHQMFQLRIQKSGFPGNEALSWQSPILVQNNP